MSDPDGNYEEAQRLLGMTSDTSMLYADGLIARAQAFATLALVDAIHGTYLGAELVGGVHRRGRVVSGLTRAGDLTVGDTTWTAGELADKGCPCVCGHHPDDHREDPAVGGGFCLTGCGCEQYDPDVEALCETCSGTGSDTYPTGWSGEDVDLDCKTCYGTGIEPQARSNR